MDMDLIRRDVSNTDRRTFSIAITDRGRELREQILPIATEMNEDAGRGISAGNKTQLFTLLNQIQKNVEG